jgi:phospholipid transport system substrate-binding protein
MPRAGIPTSPMRTTTESIRVTPRAPRPAGCAAAGLPLRWMAACCLAMLAIASPGAARADDSSPRDFIIHTTEQVVAAIKARRQEIKIDPRVAYEISEQVILPRLDFSRVTRWVLGPRWRLASEDQRRRFSEQFRTLLIHTYVSAMIQYTDEIVAKADSVTYPPVRYSPEDTEVTVRSRIQRENGTVAEVSYRLHRRDGPWKIYDVALEGVSLVSTYRSSFAVQIERNGLDGLIADLTARNAAAR